MSYEKRKLLEAVPAASPPKQNHPNGSVKRCHPIWRTPLAVLFVGSFRAVELQEFQIGAFEGRKSWTSRMFEWEKQQAEDKEKTERMFNDGILGRQKHRVAGEWGEVKQM